MAVHPSKNYFAVCEKGQNPGIYVHEYPSLKFIKVNVVLHLFFSSVNLMSWHVLPVNFLTSSSTESDASNTPHGGFGRIG